MVPSKCFYCLNFCKENELRHCSCDLHELRTECKDFKYDFMHRVSILTGYCSDPTIEQLEAVKQEINHVIMWKVLGE